MDIDGDQNVPAQSTLYGTLLGGAGQISIYREGLAQVTREIGVISARQAEAIG